MDAERFDAITKAFAAGTTRRRMLGGLVGAAVAGPLGWQDTAAKRRPKTKRGKGGVRAQEAARTWICHRTGSDTNQYEFIEVPMNAADQHLNHHGDAIGVDLQTHKEHCGRCGNACAGDQICRQGQCVSACQSPLVTCDERCVDTQSDEANCGACGTACDKNQCEQCQGGECRPPTLDVCSGCNQGTGEPEPKCGNDPTRPDCDKEGVLGQPGACVCASGITCNSASGSSCCTEFVHYPNGTRECCCNGRITDPEGEKCDPCQPDGYWCWCNSGVGGRFCVYPDRPEANHVCPDGCQRF